MLRCSLKPYEGTEKYIFISYSHQDNARVYPIIESLAEKGFRIWYDEGIDPGSEWPETIAEHLGGCEVCLAFLSENYLESQNCRREVNFALSKKKFFITVVLEPVEMSPGMEMQLSTTQFVSKYTFPDEESFYDKLCTAKYLGGCRVEPPKPKPADAPAGTERFADIAPAGDKSAAPCTPPETWAGGTPVSRSAVWMAETAEGEGMTAQTDAAMWGGAQTYAPKQNRMVPLAAMIGGGAAILIAVILLAVRLLSGGGSVSSAGKQFNANETSVSFYNEVILAEDVQNLTRLKQLKYLYFTNCTFEEGASELFRRLSETVTSLSLENCTGVDFSVISAMPSLKSLSILSCGLTDEQLASIAFGGGISSVRLSGNGDLSDLSPLRDASELTQLYVDSTAVSDFSLLAGNANLSTLSASGNGLGDISSLAGLPVQYLTLSDNEIEDLSPLSGNEKLYDLYVSGNRIDDLSPLAECTQLWELDVSDNQIDDLTPLGGMARLTILNLNNNRITSLAPLTGCEKLGFLKVNQNQLTSLEGLEYALNLQEIDAAYNQLTDIDGLTNCTILTRVNLTGNEISDISLLKKSVATLNRVYLAENQIESLDALDGAEALQYLNLDGNQVASLKPLAKSTELVGVSAADNLLTSADGLENAVKLQYLFLARNRISDAQALTTLTGQAEKDYYVLDLSGNALTGLQLGTGKTYFRLSVYGNPLASLDFLQGMKGSYLYFSYVEAASEGDVASGFSQFGIVDCPLDRQVATKSAHPGTVNFLQPEEIDSALAEEMIASLRGE